MEGSKKLLDRMAAKPKEKTELGDFQTPALLAGQVCDLLVRLEILPASIVEPTCGTGSFLRASESAFPDCSLLLGFDVNPDHVQAAQSGVKRAEVRHADFFAKNWPNTLDKLAEPILVIGNPPWVTNSTLGSINGTNLPAKSNFQRFNGLDAITGKSNFDISEWMLTHLLEWLSGRSAVLSMLCKTAVARKVLHHAWKNNCQIEKSATYGISAVDHFGASVDACLLVSVLKPGANSRECDVFATLESSEPDTTFGLHNGRLAADLNSLGAYGHLCGESPLKWRSGIKHDCSRVMELTPTAEAGLYKNGLGEIVKLEQAFLFPMLKSSDLSNGKTPSRYMLVTQTATGEDTARIARSAPLTWRYLESHADALDARSSSIYRNRPRYSVFGVGSYSFSPWKVAISGFYKRLEFRSVAPVNGSPVVLDDTCYFVPCESKGEAEYLEELLNSEAARGFFRSFVFWDAKRPITASLLASLDIGLLAEEHGDGIAPRRLRSRQALLNL